MDDAAYIVLYDEEKKILMQHRSSDAPTNPNHWGLFGGSVKPRETPRNAVIREIYEELEIHLVDPKLAFEDYIYTPGKEHTKYYFIEELKNKEDIILHEGQGYAWFDPAGLNSLLIRPYVLRAIKAIALG